MVKNKLNTAHYFSDKRDRKKLKEIQTIHETLKLKGWIEGFFQTFFQNNFPDSRLSNT